MVRHVIGLGEPMAGDDGAGPAVVRHLRRMGVPPGIELIETRDATAVLEALGGSERVVVVDAVVGAGPAGRAFVIDPAAISGGALRSISSHGVGLAETLALAALLEPEAAGRVRLVGISVAGDAHRGEGLSPEVEASVPEAAALALALVGEGAAEQAPGAAATAAAAGTAAAPRGAAEHGPRRRRLAVRGVVQGVGFRPFVYRLAHEMDVAGWVRNVNGAVEIEAQASAERLARFAQALRERHPPAAAIDSIEAQEIPLAASADFRILESSEGAAPLPALPADLATCEACLAEVRDSNDRRHLYPFTNCTHCGPRYSIVERTPYDRPRTSMKIFPLCPECGREYTDPADRRFHAEPIACPRCGPSVRLLDERGGERASHDAAIAEAARALAGGLIVAMKGLGGFQLLVDATNEEGVRRLRERKRREDKPLAVMFPTLEAIRAHCDVSEPEARALASAAAPIVLLARRAPVPARGATIADAVAPGNPRLGVMLPYTPLHHLLLEAAARPLVCTSGNVSEEPMCVETGEALEKLAGIADIFLTHNRPIVRPVDDSVARIEAGALQILRRARGFAPRAIPLPAGGPPVLAVGGHLKNVVALALGAEAIASQHIGDLETPEARDLLERTTRDLLDFFSVTPRAIACDLHPDYASTLFAERLASRFGVPLLRVQHHHAHAASALLDHGIDGHALAFTWDGVGYGADGTLWGGEALLADAGGFRRVATIRPFRLPGGERAVREPRRSATGLLFALLGREAGPLAVRWFREAEIDPLLTSLERSINAPVTSGMGRLFDAVGALTGAMPRVRFEGQAAMDLEFALDPGGDAPPYPMPLTGSDPIVADWGPLVLELLEDLRRGTPRGVMSARFHAALVEMAVAVAHRAGVSRVILSGGCFQNAALTERLRHRLEQESFEVLAHRGVPPNDGGIAFGQLLIARRRLEGGTHVSRDSR